MTIQQKLIEEGLLVDTDSAQQNRDRIEHMRLGEVIFMISKEKQNQIIEAYKRGDIVKKIALDTRCSSGEIYQVLNFYHIPKRSDDPNNPASSIETRREAGWPPQQKAIVPASQPVKEPVKINAPVTKSLGELFYEKRDLIIPWKSLSKVMKERYEQLAAGTYVRKPYHFRDWEKEKEKVIYDYNFMHLKDFLKKWGLNNNRWKKLKNKWHIPDKGRSKLAK
jgi:hypothetical protein